MSDAQRLYLDIVSQQTDLETVVLQDHSKVENIAPNITFGIMDGYIYARVPLMDEKQFVDFVREQEKKGYIIVAD